MGAAEVRRTAAPRSRYESRRRAQRRGGRRVPRCGGLEDQRVGESRGGKALREQIRPDTAKAGHHTAESSAAMARAFSAWAFGPALGDVQSEWELQVDNLMGRLASEQTSLEQTKQDFQEVDHAVKGRLTGIVTEPAPARDV